MNTRSMVIPIPKKFDEQKGIVCHLAKLNWIEAEEEHSLAVKYINRTLERLDIPQLPHHVGKMNLGTRQRISLQVNSNLPPESYKLDISNESIVITGGDSAGVFYGTQTLCQIMAVSAEFGGHDRYLPVAIIQDAPRFTYRGLMLDSSRHFQKKETILKLLDQMAIYKLNRFHWHLVDRQSWRLPLNFAPELTRDVPRSRAYSFGAYTRSEIEEIRLYAEKRHITVVPEIEMPGHSAAVFYSRPELACPISDDPYKDDFWEFCLGNSAVSEFLSKVLQEVCEMFPNSPLIHIGGDEASLQHWEKCPHCQKRLKELKLPDERALEQFFMKEMEAVVKSLGRQAMTWGTPHSNGEGFSESMIIQNWLAEDTKTYLNAGRRIVNSYHCYNYFDYPAGDSDPISQWQKLNYEFDPAAGVSDEAADLVLGGEGCIWTEQIPQWRLLPRAIPRLRALAEMLWSSSEQKDFEDFQLRERLLTGTDLYRFS